MSQRENEKYMDYILENKWSFLSSLIPFVWPILILVLVMYIVYSLFCSKNDNINQSTVAKNVCGGIYQ